MLSLLNQITPLFDNLLRSPLFLDRSPFWDGKVTNKRQKRKTRGQERKVSVCDDEKDFLLISLKTGSNASCNLS